MVDRAGLSISMLCFPCMQKLQEWRAALVKMTFEDEKYRDMA